MEWKEKEILVIVKAYPTPSTKYGETVCTAGITKDGKWIRLYPIQFRDLPSSKQYDKFQWIKVKVSPSNEPLRRPESHKVDMDSIEVLKTLEAGKGWIEREKVFLPAVSSSLEELEDLKETKKVSLGAFMPKKVTQFRIEKGENVWTPKQTSSLVQESFFGKKKIPLEKIPYTFHYKFTCNDSRCKGHDLIIIDWEINQCYRSWRKTYKTDELTLEMIHKKWFEYFFQKRESYFVVGTDSQYNKFMILGIVSPRRKNPQLPIEF